MLFPSRLCCYPTPCSGPINSATCSCFLPPVLSFTSWHQLHRGQLSLPHLFSLLSPRLGVLPQAHSPDIYKAPARCPRWRPALSFLELCSHSPNKGDLIKKKSNTFATRRPLVASCQVSAWWCHRVDGWTGPSCIVPGGEDMDSVVRFVTAVGK